jgi:hypothetical protein
VGASGGLAAAKVLKHTPAHITVIDRNNHHLFQPLLYQVATSELTPGQIGSPIRNILRNQSSTTVILAPDLLNGRQAIPNPTAASSLLPCRRKHEQEERIRDGRSDDFGISRQ